MIYARVLAKAALVAVLISVAPVAYAGEQPKSIMERIFFHVDIYNFSGKVFESPAFGKLNAISQPFTSSCSDMNRIILGFFVKGRLEKDEAVFNLYESGEKPNRIFSTVIDLAALPEASRIGTHDVDGVLHNVWIPPQSNSRNKKYIWELKRESSLPPSEIGLFLTHHANPRLKPIIIDGAPTENDYAAFYSYCVYRFGWENTVIDTWRRLAQEKYFLVVYLLLLSGLAGVVIRTREKRE